jgi:hypothetical protein
MPDWFYRASSTSGFSERGQKAVLETLKQGDLDANPLRRAKIPVLVPVLVLYGH